MAKKDTYFKADSSKKDKRVEPKIGDSAAFIGRQNLYLAEVV